MSKFETKDGIFLPIFRYTLIAIGSTLVTKGYVTAEQLDSVVGALMMLGTTGWLVYNKKVKGV